MDERLIDDPLRQAELTELLEEVGRLRKEGDRLTLAKALRRLGEFERRPPDMHAARRHYEEAVAALREAKEPLLLAHTVRHLGDVYYDAGSPVLAERCYDEALALYHGHDHAPPLDVANAARSLAVLKDADGRSEEAARLWEEARDLYMKVGVTAGVAESAARLALLAKRMGDLSLTRRRLAEASADAGEDPGRARIEGDVEGPARRSAVDLTEQARMRDQPQPRENYVCLQCLHERQTFAIRCPRCGSRRVEHVEFKRQQLGEHWRELLRVDEGKVN